MAIPIPHHRPFRRAEVLAAGVPRRALDDAVRSGVLDVPFRGVYLPAHLDSSPEARAAAVGLVLPRGAAVARTTAAWLHGVDARLPGRHREPPPLECVVRAGATPIRRAGLMCVASALPSDQVADVAGVPVTTPVRTAADVARFSPRFIGLGALDAFARSGAAAPDDVMALLRRHPGERFVARARELVEWCDPAAESAGESWMRLRVLDAGLPRPRLQIPLRRPDGRVEFRLDMGWEEARVAIEYDGEEFHGRTPQQDAADRRRRAAILDRYGWTAIGVTSEHVFAARPAVEHMGAELLGWTAPIRRRTW